MTKAGFSTAEGYFSEAQERVDEALDRLARLELGDIDTEAAMREFEEAQAYRKEVAAKWLRRG